MDTNDTAMFDAATADAAAMAAAEAIMAGKETPVDPAPTTAAAPANPESPHPPSYIPTTPVPAPAPALPDAVAQDLARRVAEVARMESESVQRQQALRAEVEASKQREAAALAKLDALERALRENPIKELEQRQWTLESLVHSAATLSTPEAVERARLAKEVEAVKADLAKRDAEAAERAAAAAKAEAHAKLVNQLIPTHIATIKDELPLLHAWCKPEEINEAVYGLMGQKFKETKGASTLEPEEAARQLEKALSDRVQRLPGAKVTPPTQPAASSLPTVTVRPSATITNQMTQSGPGTGVINPTDFRSLDERALALVSEAMKSNQKA